MGSERVLVLEVEGLCWEAERDAPAAGVSGYDCEAVLESFTNGPRPSVGGSLLMSIEKPEDTMMSSVACWSEDAELTRDRDSD